MNAQQLIQNHRLMAPARSSLVAVHDPYPPPVDELQRPLLDLRLSVTDRCNFRCTYCMPRANLGMAVAPTNRRRLLSFEELTDIARAFATLGVKKLRLTGGEPLVRRDLARLVEQLAKLSIQDLCLTTNGALLASQAKGLADAGLRRVTVSLDALDETTFQRMTDGHTPLSAILRGIDVARASGLDPVKINMVVQRGVNEHSILPMADWARRNALELRFIEYMDVGCSNGWQPQDVVTAAEIYKRLHHIWPLQPLCAESDHSTAERFRYADNRGKIGIVASISRPFCGGCTRARVSSVGELFPCLFAHRRLDLAAALRQGVELPALISDFWRRRDDRYSENRFASVPHKQKPEMSAIGG